jgi:hypothetical protein
MFVPITDKRKRFVEFHHKSHHLSPKTLLFAHNTAKTTRYAARAKEDRTE